MNTRTILRLTPTLLILAAMGWAAYSISVAPTPMAVPTVAAKPGPPPATSDPSPAIAPELGRNPFVIVSRGVPEKDGGRPSAADGPGDPLLATVHELVLNATFVQGGTRYASINGRLYRQGQRVAGPGNVDTPLAVAQVDHSEVVLVAGSNRYRLGYPEDFSAPNPAVAASPRGGAGTGGSRGRSAPARGGARGVSSIPGSGPGPARTGGGARR